ncbi:MAG TPA: 2-oxoacid:acceptor oxidoreductase family protein [Candidatus Gastranaerophilales bacterium]|nr:2-oxoacid:acceptor oxidoreductase family protein [Candidatus Gastranaerophilales bacterium]
MARTKIVLAGEGGHGVQSIAKILVEAGYAANKEVLYIPNFGVEQRGGVSIAFCQIADEPIGEPRFSKGDIVIALSDRAIARCACYVDENTTVVYDTSICHTKPQMKAKQIIGIPANKIANDELDARVFNIIILGTVIKATQVVDMQYVKEAMEKALGKKFDAKPELREMNYKALERGMAILEEKASV